MTTIKEKPDDPAWCDYAWEPLFNKSTGKDVTTFRGKAKTRARLQWELAVLKQWGDLPKCEPHPTTGLCWWQHLLLYMKMLEFPYMRITPWFEMMAEDTARCIDQNNKVYNLIGSKSSGKCLAPGTEVRMFDGSTKAVEDVQLGDTLMGDDSTPRKVVRLFSGRDEMYEVFPAVGDPYTVTADHSLSTLSPKGERRPPISAADFSKLKTWKRYTHRGYSAAYELPEKDVEMCPYVYGLWLGDGSRHKPTITTMDEEIREAWSSYFEADGYTIRREEKPGSKAASYHISSAGRSRGEGYHAGRRNPVFNFFRASQDLGGKFVREEYLRGSIKQRRQLLAGIVDTDGYLSNGTCYEVTLRENRLATQVREVANSLGYRTSLSRKQTSYRKQNGNLARAWIVRICGDLTTLPVRLPHKIARPPKKPHGATGLRVEPRGEGDYFGFELDGNHRFLLASGDVTYNSAWMGRLAVSLITIDPEYSSVFVASPFKNTANFIIWGEIQDVWQKAKKRLEGIVEMHEVPSKHLLTIGKTPPPKAGFVQLVGLDNVGKLQGAKPRDPERGVMLVVADEIGLWQSHAFIDILDNITVNENLLVETGCNFKDIEGLEGKLCRPRGREYSELDPDIDQCWPCSDYRGFTRRLDGHLNPNVQRTLKARHKGEIDDDTEIVLYPFLLRESSRLVAEETHTKRGPKYLEQIRSFPNHAMADYYVLTRDKAHAAGAYTDDFSWTGAKKTRVVMLDPGFGGDPCVIGAADFGEGLVPDLNGGWNKRTIFAPVEPFHAIQLDADKVADADWISRLTHQSGGVLIAEPGSRVTLEQQIAVQAGEYCERHGVHRTQFGFDGSMREDLMSEMFAVLGRQVHAIRFGGEASDDRDAVGYPDTPAKTLYFNKVSELYFNFARMVQAGHMRNGQLSEAGLQQLFRRPWSEKGKRKQIQPKVDYKAANKDRSPDHADVLVGLFEMALRHGFFAEVARRPGAGQAHVHNAVSNLMARSTRFGKRRAQRLSR